MSKLIVTEMATFGNPCYLCVLEEEGQIMELRGEPVKQDSRKTASGDSILGNIYVGKVENLASHIQAAFVMITPDIRAYFPLSEAGHVIYASGKKKDGPLRPGDEILVQVSRDAMKGKLPALTANLNFTGKYLVLTTGEKKFGLSKKLSGEDKSRLSKWLEEEILRPDKEYGLVVRTNAGEAEKEEILSELEYLKACYEKVAVQGRNRTCFSLLSETEPSYISAVRDCYSRNLEEIITDVPKVYERIKTYLTDTSPEECGKLKLYQDKLLPLYKLYRIEHALEEIRREKVWLKSGGFLVIQQTEAFVSIDVNSGKFAGKKKAEETYRKINIEAAKEIARQLRLRNLSGIILIDFINMENPDHREELFHILKKLLRKDSVRSRAVDITPLNILEMTRKKVRRPVMEELQEIFF